MLDTPDLQEMLAYLGETFGRLFRAAEPLARHGTFGVGGPADAWISVESEQTLIQLTTLAAQRRWPLMLVGNGTNVLYSDAGARGIVARMALNEWSVEPLDASRGRLRAGAGVNLPKLVNDLAAQGWSGLEWAAGVPGTVGGAVVSNAGVNQRVMEYAHARTMCIADTLESARVLFAPGAPEGEPERPVVRELPAEALNLTYRHSRFRADRRISFDDDGRPQAAPRSLIEPPEIITGGVFLLEREEPEDIQRRVRAFRQHRLETQPSQGSAGSVFKNPEGHHAAALIQKVGLKGHAIGGAQISDKHANFIVNTGGATAADVVALIALARRTVREREGVELELEVELRGDW